MKDEKKVLGILSIVFGGIAIVGSWVPFLNNGSFIVGLFGLIPGSNKNTRKKSGAICKIKKVPRKRHL